MGTKDEKLSLDEFLSWIPNEITVAVLHVFTKRVLNVGKVLERFRRNRVAKGPQRIKNLVNCSLQAKRVRSVLNGPSVMAVKYI